MATKYERLQALTVKKEVKQGVFVYTPLATFLKAGIVLPYDEHFEIGEINEKITLQIHPNIIQEIIDATVNIEDIFDGSKVVGKAEQDQLGNIINFTYSTKSELLAEINKLINGTTLVDKAKKDQAGNVIDDTYASKIGIGASTSPTDKKLTIRIYTPKQDRTQATPNLSSVTYTIDSATSSAAGLMSASDKAKLDDLPTDAKLTDAYLGYYVARAKADKDGKQFDTDYIKKANIVNSVISLDTDKPLSAYQGKVLKDLIDNLFNLLASDDTDLDELQELVDYIKANREDLDAVGINKINYTDIIDNLTTANAELPLSANQGKVLKDDLDTLNNKMVSSMLIVEDYNNNTGEITLHTSYSTTYDSSSGEITFTI